MHLANETVANLTGGMWEISGAEPSHSSRGHPGPASQQPTWQLKVDVWEDLPRSAKTDADLQNFLIEP